MASLPLPLLLLAVQVLSQSQQPLQIDQIYTQNQGNALPNFLIPASPSLFVSVALCSSSKEIPKFSITNSSVPQNPSADGAQDNYDIVLENGFGIFSGPFPAGGQLKVEGNIDDVPPFEIGVSSSGSPIHRILDAAPLLGDTTANQVLVFSPPFDPPILQDPTYPTYSLPSANTTAPLPPPSLQQTDFNILIQSTADLNDAALPQTGCAIRNAAENSTAKTIASQQLWLKDGMGWRNQWVVEALNPATNYTVWVVVNNTEVSTPAHFATKSGVYVLANFRWLLN